MGETLNLLFRSRENGIFELQVKETWSGRTVSGSFVPPYTNRQLNALQKRLSKFTSSVHDMREIGYRLFLALCGAETPGTSRSDLSEQSVQAMLRSVIQRTLRRRGTVALTLSFAAGCDEFARYPWELLHNGEHFLLASGVFTLTRALLRQGEAVSDDLPVHPPLRMLYISASPRNCPSLETERSFEAMQRALAGLMEKGHILLDKIDQVTFDDLVGYLSLRGGVGLLDDNETAFPCYVVHFDGHGAFGRLCPDEDCQKLNDADVSKCIDCQTSLSGMKAQTYLCFCDEAGDNRYIDTQSLREIFISSDVRLVVLSACETATVRSEGLSHEHRGISFDNTLATSLIMAQVPAVVAMPYSLYDDISPIFMFHFYEALAQGRTLEEALSRARSAMLPKHNHQGWFVPVLYRHVSDGQQGPVALIAGGDASEDHDHPLGYLEGSTTFVGRERELRELSNLLALAARDEEPGPSKHESSKLRPGTHHIALTGPAGIGKSALAIEAIRRNRELFSGGTIGLSLQGGKLFNEALLDIAHHLHAPTKSTHAEDQSYRQELVLSFLRSRAGRDMPCLLFLDSFEDVKEHHQLELWHRFFSALPQEVVVLVSSRSNPAAIAVIEGAPYRWYEYSVDKMVDADLLRLFAELAAESGLDLRIHMDDPQQQKILQEICALLEGYPLGAELIFGAARAIEGKVYTPEAATRSLEEVRDELRDSQLAGIFAVLDVAYHRLTPLARLLLSYLAAFRLPFGHEQIVLLVAPENHAPGHLSIALLQQRSLVARPFESHPSNDAELRQIANDASASSYRSGNLEGVRASSASHSGRMQGRPTGSLDERSGHDAVPVELAQNWRAARDELVQASFMQFDGRVYTIHAQIRNFALLYLPIEERRRVHRVVAAYYRNQPQPSPEEWFVAYEHLEGAGEPQDLQEAILLAVDASWAMNGRGHAPALLHMLRRAEAHALRLGNKTVEGRLQCCIGAILRQLGQYAEAVGCLTRSLALHREQNDRDEIGWALYELAMLFREEGHFQQAGLYAQESLHIFREVGDPKGEAWMQMVMGEVSRGLGAYYEALGHFELALASFRNVYSEEGIASTLRDRGTVYEALGQYSNALADFEEALRLFNTLGLRAGQAWVLADQGVVYGDQGKLDLAEQTCSEAIAIFREQKIRRGEGWALRALGDIARERRNWGDARGYYEDALTIFGGLGDRVDHARVMNSLGAVAFDDGEHLEAKEHFEMALAIGQEQGARQIEGRALRGLGDVARVLHHYAEAEHAYQSAFNIAVDLDTPAERCAVLRRQGALSHVRQQYRDALEFWVQALALDQRLGHPARKDLQERVEALVQEQELDEIYGQLSNKYGLT
jgi:tetratricopeptide (TPR) repeat protein